MSHFTRRDGLKLVLGGAVGLPLLVAAKPAEAGVVYEIEVRNFAFSPNEISAKPGDTLRFTNSDGAPHTATARDGSFDTGTLKSGQSGDVKLSAAPGEYAFFCKFHPKMKGVVKVS